MLITIFLLILIFSIMGKPVDKLVAKVRNANWTDLTTRIRGDIRKYGRKAGRAACRPVLTFYYVMKGEKVSLTDKALIYGAILYIVSPVDLVPRRLLRFIGVLDDAVVLTYVTKKVKEFITPEINLKVESTLDEWFGYKITLSDSPECSE